MTKTQGRTRVVRARRLSVALMLCWLTPMAALGHALLMESSPKQDEALKAPATQAVLRFDARIEKSMTRVRLVDGEGNRVKMPAMAEDKDETADRPTVALPEVKTCESYPMQLSTLAAECHAA